MPSGRMVLVGPFDSLRVNRLIESKYAPIIMGVLTMVVALLDTHDQEARDTSSLKAVSHGGSMVAPGLVRRVQNTFGCGFSTLYDQSEHSPVITGMTRQRQKP